jgi:hypothetical protein
LCNKLMCQKILCLIALIQPHRNAICSSGDPVLA